MGVAKAASNLYFNLDGTLKELLKDYSIMKAGKAIIYKFGNASEIKIVEEKLEEPGPGEVRIKVEASTVSATDIFIRKGIYPLIKQKPPLGLGYDFVGVVDAVGKQVYKYKAGDRVADVSMIDGNAEYIIRNESTLLKVSTAIEAEKAACLVMTGMTAYQIFKSLNFKKGDHFLIHGGAGGIGSMLLQLCKLHGVHAVASASKHKHHFIKNQNAIPLDYNDPDYFENLKRTSGTGFNAVYDFTNQQSFNTSYKLLKKGGTLITTAVYTSGKKIVVKNPGNYLKFFMDFGLMMLKVNIWNSLPNQKKARFFGIADSKNANQQQYQHDFFELQQLVMDGKINPAIHRTYTLQEIGLAHQELEDGKAIGYLVIKN